MRKLTISQRSGFVGVDVLRLCLLAPRHGATISSGELQTKFSSDSSTDFLGSAHTESDREREKKKSVSPTSFSSRNAHVNVIIIINNALRFITVP